jgi:hypothetical protein
LLETYGLVRADGAAYRRVTGEPTAP